MPFRASFDCLWCGRPWTARSPEDLEGWAALCPDCLGRAGENAFLRFRLKAALRDRAAAATAGQVEPVAPHQLVARVEPGAHAEPIAPVEPTARARASVHAEAGAHADSVAPVEPIGFPSDGVLLAADADDLALRAYYAARAPEYDDWYLRRGRYARGPVLDLPWHGELDAATRWLDARRLDGEIVELAAGTGWWSPLLAQMGSLWVYDAAPEMLDRARDRLVAHGLRAHIHVRDAWSPPDRTVDGLFCGFWLSHVRRARLDAFLRLCAAWLKPGGRFCFIDSLPDLQSGARDHDPVAANGTSLRRLADGREFRIPKIHYTPDELRQAVLAAGFARVTVETTGRFFLLGVAER